MSVIVYYSCGAANETLLEAVRKNLTKMAGVIPIISVTDTPIDFGQNIVIPAGKRGYNDLFNRMMIGVEAAPENSIIYLAEDDVFYTASHFVKTPQDDEAVYFNTNRYYWAVGQDSYLPMSGTQAWSQGMFRREYMLTALKKYFASTERDADLHVRHYEWQSAKPNVDIRHGANFTRNGREKNLYLAGRSKKVVRSIPQWGSTKYFQLKTGYRGVA